MNSFDFIVVLSQFVKRKVRYRVNCFLDTHHDVEDHVERRVSRMNHSSLWFNLVWLCSLLLTLRNVLRMNSFLIWHILWVHLFINSTRLDFELSSEWCNLDLELLKSINWRWHSIFIGNIVSNELSKSSIIKFSLFQVQIFSKLISFPSDSMFHFRFIIALILKIWLGLIILYHTSCYS